MAFKLHHTVLFDVKRLMNKLDLDDSLNLPIHGFFSLLSHVIELKICLRKEKKAEVLHKMNEHAHHSIIQ